MPTRLMSHLSPIRVLQPQVAGNVAITQLTGTDPNYPPVIPYHVAHAGGLVEITERGGPNAVSELTARNLGKGYVLILEGEVIVGAKQNRTLNTSILLPPGSITVIPVSCVERGRWSGRTDSFTPSDDFVTPDMRAKKIRGVHRDLKSRGRYGSDQGQVWNDISDRISFAKIGSSSESFTDFADAGKAGIDGILPKFPRQEGAVGMVGFIGGKIVGCDVIPSPEVFSEYYDRLLRSYALDSMYLKGRPESSVDYGALSWRFLTEIGETETGTFTSPGAGLSVRVAGPGISGAALLFEGSMIHLGAFSLNARRL